MQHCKMVAVWLGLGTKATWLGLAENKCVSFRAAFSLKPGISQYPKLGVMFAAL